MSLLGYLLVLTGAFCCTAVPVSDPAAPPGSCEAPPTFKDIELQGDWNEKFYNPGKQAQYACRPGFIRLGSIRYVCSEGTWQVLGTRGQCKKKSCGHPGDIEFGTFELKEGDEFVFGAIVEYTCNDGYQMISRHRTRECTATGWSNYRPECEVRMCPPVQVNSNVNLLTTSYDEEYSVGQVIRFECKNANQKLKGAAEIFCTSEGEWNAPPPICEEISCSKPEIAHGRVTYLKPRYNDRETTEYSCDPGYKPATPTGLVCTKNDWSPMPLCEEIVCYRQTVKNGIAGFLKETYREGETIELVCNEGYQIEHKPEEPRKCTSNGWSPPLQCISKKCDRPVVLNGYIYSGWYSFPMSTGRYFDSVCNSGFLTSSKESYDRITCTKNGWDREPKCFRRCNPPSQNTINAFISYANPNVYIEGEKLHFQCYKDYTFDGKQSGEMTCRTDGRFSGEKCHRTCQIPELANGVFQIKKNAFEVGEYVTYECYKGFFSSDKAYEGRSQCSSAGWLPKPECKEITCDIEFIGGKASFKSGNSVRLKCPEDYELDGSNSSQCFYYGWGPELPICKGPRGQESLFLVDFNQETKDSNCPPAFAPPNAQVINPKKEYFSEDVMEIACNLGYLLHGPEKVLCKDGKWQSPPLCIKKVPCNSSPPKIDNGKISRETLRNEYYTGSTVEYICNDGYHIVGSNESQCLDGNWLPPPTCVENSCGKPPEVKDGKPQDDSKEYKHAERAAYKCSPGYTLSGSEPAVCHFGKWERVPTCNYSSCEQPPNIKNGGIKGPKKTTYLPGEKVTYECFPGFTMGKNPNVITCENSIWADPPECKRIGQACGAPPVVQNGDTTDLKRLSYPSGSSVKFKCANYYKLEGKDTITCRNGEWEKEPICRVPCTAGERDMQQNNIHLRWKGDKKLYSEHGDTMEFACLPGYEKPGDKNELRIQCLDGVLNYPKCRKTGFCVLQQTEMARNNIQYNKSNEIDNDETIEFECLEGMLPENDLKGRCKNTQITYPKCSTGRSCLPPKISNALVSPEKDSYESGSSIDIKCEDTFVLKGHTNVKCENGQWDELPQCFKPCTTSALSLYKNHIEIKSSEDPPEILEHGTEVNVKCKANFRRPGALSASCSDGTMKYPRCFSGCICRINQQDLDDNFLELDERHEYEVFYGEGETVYFKCKDGYSSRTRTTGKCFTPSGADECVLTYPACK